MDASIVNAAITSVASVVTCLIGLHAGRKSSDRSSVQKIREKQLNCLFLPLEQQLTFASHKDATEVIKNMTLIIRENLSLVPPVLLDEFLRLSNTKTPTPENLSALSGIINSFYNELRKSLGYPYDKDAIKIDNIYVSKRFPDIRKPLSVALSVLSLFLLFCTGVAGEHQYTFTSVLSLFCTILLLVQFCIFTTVALQSNNR